MTREDKDLLLKDLCGRLPYGVMCYCKWTKYAPNGTKGCVQELSTFLIDEIEIMDNHEYDCQICDVKPYLRPMSSMTDNERKEYESFIFTQHHEWDGHGTSTKYVEVDDVERYVTWLNKKGFDYRGLIPMGLALEATHEIYPELIEKPITIPNNLEEAVNSLNEILSKEDKEYVLKEGALAVHHDLGRWIRNNWGLWEEEPNELKKSLIDKGFSHPDDMSNYIIEEYIRKNTTES